MIKKMQHIQPVIWESFPSWAQFSWLYLLSAVSLLRGALFFRFGLAGWEMWILGAGILLACAAILRHWVCYDLTRDQITARNGYTRRAMQSVPLSDVASVTIQQGRIADFFGIGTVLVHVRSSDRVLSLRGVRDPEAVKIRIDALAGRQDRAANHPPEHPAGKE
ncbi:MAG TPA: PH domain-containing protein [Nitrospira sp.]|nr:PH domain-containing protein [Nitrospira sp.]